MSEGATVVLEECLVRLKTTSTKGMDKPQAATIYGSIALIELVIKMLQDSNNEET